MVKTVVRKAMDIRPSGRSTDYISPSFGYGCLFNCSYCYMKRHLPEGLTIASNTDSILQEIDRHVHFYSDVQKPNQTHAKLITYDISCNEDFALHAKYHDWQKIFTFFKDHDYCMGSFATKTVPTRFLSFDPKQKIRIRFSLMPQNIASVLEPNTAKISDRIQAIDTFIDAGYDVHVNFSPIVLYKGWKDDYKHLFEELNSIEHKDVVKAECIFLTHNKNKHQYNLDHGLPGEDLLWVPNAQEDKVSQYGGKNIRYKYMLKNDAIKQFIQIHDDVIPWNTIRYIF